MFFADWLDVSLVYKSQSKSKRKSHYITVRTRVGLYTAKIHLTNMFVTWIYSWTVFTWTAGRLSLENSSGAQDYVIYFQFSWRYKNNLRQVLTFLTGLKWKKDDVIPFTTQRLGTFILKCDERYWVFADVFRQLSIKYDTITHKQSCWSRLAKFLTLLRWGHNAALTAQQEGSGFEPNGWIGAFLYCFWIFSTCLCGFSPVLCIFPIKVVCFHSPTTLQRIIRCFKKQNTGDFHLNRSLKTIQIKQSWKRHHSNANSDRSLCFILKDDKSLRTSFVGKRGKSFLRHSDFHVIKHWLWHSKQI